MIETESKFVEALVDAIQDKKGKELSVVDFRKTDNSVCDFFVICQANNRNQIEAIARNISEQAKEKADERAIGVTGEDNAVWIAIDFGNIMVHIFQPEARGFYDLEHLWADARIERIPDLDSNTTAV